MPRSGPVRRFAPALAGAVVLVLTTTGVLVLARPSERPPSPPAHVASASTPLPADPAGSGAPWVAPVGEDWAVDAAIRAAVVAQQRSERAAPRRAVRPATPAHPPGTPGLPVDLVPVGAAPVDPLPVGDEQVWVVGDSIAAGISNAWPGAHGTLAVPGARSTTVVPQVVAALARTSARPTLVVALGTNDDPLEPALFEQEVRELLRAAPGCVVWVGVHRPGGRWAPLNDVLRVRARSAGGALQVAGWDRLAAADPSLLQPDGIHPRTGTVYTSIVGLVQRAAQRCT